MRILKESNREKIQKTRQEMLKLLDDCKWDLAGGKYSEAMKKIDTIKKILNQLIADIL